MQSIVESTLPYFFALIILIGILWMVIQKASTLAGLCKRKLTTSEETIEGSDNYHDEDSKSLHPSDIQSKLSSLYHKSIHTKQDNITLQVKDGLFDPSRGNGNKSMNLDSYINQIGFCKSTRGTNMTSDSDNAMTEPNSTNYTSVGGRLGSNYTKL